MLCLCTLNIFLCFQRLKRERKVFYIAQEVVKSEEVFVDVLKLLNVVCVHMAVFCQIPYSIPVVAYYCRCRN